MVSRIIELISIYIYIYSINQCSITRVFGTAVVCKNPVLGGHSLFKLISTNKLKSEYLLSDVLDETNLETKLYIMYRKI
jgi:hypothetical protein